MTIAQEIADILVALDAAVYQIEAKLEAGMPASQVEAFKQTMVIIANNLIQLTGGPVP